MKCDFCDKEATEESKWPTEGVQVFFDEDSGHMKWTSPPNSTCDEHRAFASVCQKDIVFDYLKCDPVDLTMQGLKDWEEMREKHRRARI